MLVHNQRCKRVKRFTNDIPVSLWAYFSPGKGGRGRGKKEGRVSGELIQ